MRSHSPHPDDRPVARLAVILAIVALLGFLLLPLLPANAQGAPAAKPAPGTALDSLHARAARDTMRASGRDSGRDSGRNSGRDSARLAMVSPAARGALLRAIDGASAMSDSQYTADTTAILRGLFHFTEPAPAWFWGGVVIVTVGSIDRDGDFAYRDTYRSQDKLVHFAAGAAIAGIVGDATPAWKRIAAGCGYSTLYEVAQMRPSGWPAAHRGQRYGRFSGRDAVAGCGGAVTEVVLGEAWKALR